MTIKEIEEALDEGNSLKTIAQAYSEIANLKIKRIRNETERNRVFFEEISYVYGLIRLLADKKKVTVQKTKKTLSIIITSNYHFYGSINSDLINFFVSTSQKFPADALLIGKAAIDYFKVHSQLLKGGQTQKILKKDMPDSLELKELVDLVKDYSQVLIYYSKMKSLLVQQPDIKDLAFTRKWMAKDSLMNFKFIFEPDLEKILSFFDSQILTLILEDAFLESELSRTASRFIAMDSAETEANKFIKEYLGFKSYIKRGTVNNTILENFASMMNTKKGAYGRTNQSS